MTNVLWYNSDTTAASAIGDAIAAAFASGSGPYLNFYSVTARVYDHAAPLHSPPVYTKQISASGFTGMGPRQVALCLSFYSGLNIKGQRGRIYIGPWKASDLTEYASAGAMGVLITLANNLKTPGGADVIHRIHHVKTDTFSNVSNYFVNNRWDTMRSRLPKETSRLHTP